MSENGDVRVLVNDHSGHPFQVQLSRELANRGYIVLHTYCASFLSPRGNLEKKPGDSDNINILGVRLDSDFEKYALIQRWRQERQLGHRLEKLVKDFCPDVVISSNAPLGTQAILQSAAIKKGACFIFWMQDALGVGYRNTLRRRLPVIGNAIGFVFQFYEHRLVKKSNATIVITEDFLPYLPASVTQRDAVSIIENWAPLDELPLAVKHNNWAEAHGLAETTNLLYSGTLGLKHNPGLLCGLAKALSDRQDVRVVVASEGPGADWLAERKRSENLENLILLPFQAFDDMPQMLASADLLLALLEKDAGPFAVPSKVLTYLCACRPLLLAVPRENLSAKIVEDNSAGVAVTPDKVDEFVRQGMHLLDSPEVAAQYARNGREYAERTFDLRRIADRFEAIILQGVAHKDGK